MFLFGYTKQWIHVCRQTVITYMRKVIKCEPTILSKTCNAFSTSDYYQTHGNAQKYTKQMIYFVVRMIFITFAS